LSAPELWVCFTFEGEPRLIPNAEHEGDLVRPIDWLSRSRYRNLIAELAPGWCGVATGAAA
jgi:hypothetical protein